MKAASRCFLPGLLLLSCLAAQSVCRANKKAYIPTIKPPVQNYAVIDLSGNVQTSPVTLVALNDANQAAFGFYSGEAVDLVSDYSTYQVYTWQAGTSKALPANTMVQYLGNDGDDRWAVSNVICLTPTGVVYGNTVEWLVKIGTVYPEGPIRVYGCPNLPSPPYCGIDDGLNSASNNKYIKGSGIATLHDNSPRGLSDISFGFIKATTGQFTLFKNSSYFLGGVAVADEVTVVDSIFEPEAVNSAGKSIGEGADDFTAMF